MDLLEIASYEKDLKLLLSRSSFPSTGSRTMQRWHLHLCWFYCSEESVHAPDASEGFTFFVITCVILNGYVVIYLFCKFVDDECKNCSMNLNTSLFLFFNLTFSFFLDLEEEGQKWVVLSQKKSYS